MTKNFEKLLEMFKLLKDEEYQNCIALSHHNYKIWMPDLEYSLIERLEFNTELKIMRIYFGGDDYVDVDDFEILNGDLMVKFTNQSFLLKVYKIDIEAIVFE